jgi:hypothetical protein
MKWEFVLEEALWILRGRGRLQKIPDSNGCVLAASASPKHAAILHERPRCGSGPCDPNQHFLPAAKCSLPMGVKSRGS